MGVVAPVSKLRKAEIIWLQNHRCQHQHTYLEHYNCFITEIVDGSEWVPGENIPIPHKIGYFDIETTGFDANSDIMLCYCILDDSTDKIIESCLPPVKNMKDYKRLVKYLDKFLIKQLMKDLKKFDRVIGYYSTKFDIPFSRTRALHWGMKFPEFTQLLHTDVYYMVRSKLRLSRNKLEWAAKTILGGERVNKTHLDLKTWRQAGLGQKTALKYILEHCRADVIDLKNVHKTLTPYVGRRNTSV